MILRLSNIFIKFLSSYHSPPATPLKHPIDIMFILVNNDAIPSSKPNAFDGGIDGKQPSPFPQKPWPCFPASLRPCHTISHVSARACRGALVAPANETVVHDIEEEGAVI